jgi:hypothetical protein
MPGNVPAVNTRRATPGDVKDVRAMLSASGATSLFGESVLSGLERAMELNVVSIVALDAAGSVVGYASATDHLDGADTHRVLGDVQEVVADAVVSVSRGTGRVTTRGSQSRGNEPREHTTGACCIEPAPSD